MKTFDFPSRVCRSLLGIRWTASVLLLILIDLASYMAFRQSSGHALFEHSDKVFHFLGFLGLAIVGFLALSFDWFPQRKGVLPYVAIFNLTIWSLYGASIELIQGLLPWRQASLGDFWADVLGIGFGIWFAWSQNLHPDYGVKNG